MSGVNETRLAVGTRLERYEIVRFIANGGFGDVYEARDTRLGRRVVVKSLRAEVAAAPETRARFLREGRLAAAIEHANVVRIFDVIEDHGGDAFLVMEYLDGHDLGAELAARGPLPIEWFCDLMVPICAAVAQVHARGVLHRDIKPGNIFLSHSADGEIVPKLLDFGISRPLDDQTGDVRTRTGTILGSPRYMSPEQFDGKRKPDERADVYALGAVLYRCLTGALPYQHHGDDSQVELITVVTRIAARDLIPPRSWRPELNPMLEQVIVRAMAHDREQRFNDARELGIALLPFVSAGTRARWEPVLSRAARATVDSMAVSSARPNEHVATMSVDVTTNSASVASITRPPAPQPHRHSPLIPVIGAAVAIVLVATIAGVAVRSRRAPLRAATPPTETPAISAVIAAPQPAQVAAPHSPVSPPPAVVRTPPSAEASPLGPSTPSASPTTATTVGRNTRRSGRHGTRSTTRPSAQTPESNAVEVAPAAAQPSRGHDTQTRCTNGADCAL